MTQVRAHLQDAALADLRTAFVAVKAPLVAREEADFVIEGNVRRMDASYRLSFELRRRHNDEVIWTQQIDEPAASMEFAKAPSIATKATRQLGHLRRVDAAGLETKAARDEFLAALSEESRGDVNWRAYHQRMERVLAFEPANPYVLMESANAAYVVSGGPSKSAKDAQRSAHERISRFLELSPDATFMLAVLNNAMDLDYQSALQNLDHEIYMNGPSGSVEGVMGTTYLNMGLLDEALIHVNNALSYGAFEPFNVLIQLAAIHMSAGRFEAALEAFDRAAAATVPGYFRVLALVGGVEMTFRTDQRDESKRRLEDAWKSFGARYRHYFPYALALNGRRAEAQQILDEAEARFDDGAVPDLNEYYVVFRGHHMLGNKAETFVWLMRFIEYGKPFFGTIGQLKKAPIFDDLRGDSRFDDALARLAEIESRGSPVQSVATRCYHGPNARAPQLVSCARLAEWTSLLAVPGLVGVRGFERVAPQRRPGPEVPLAWSDYRLKSWSE